MILIDMDHISIESSFISIKKSYNEFERYVEEQDNIIIDDIFVLPRVKQLPRIEKSIVYGSIYMNDPYSDECGSLINSLAGIPHIIYGNFDCSYCNNLSSFTGFPEVSGEKILIHNCASIKTISDIKIETLFKIYKSYKKPYHLYDMTDVIKKYLGVRSNSEMVEILKEIL